MRNEKQISALLKRYRDRLDDPCFEAVENSIFKETVSLHYETIIILLEWVLENSELEEKDE